MYSQNVDDQVDVLSYIRKQDKLERYTRNPTDGLNDRKRKPEIPFESVWPYTQKS